MAAHVVGQGSWCAGECGFESLPESVGNRSPLDRRKVKRYAKAAVAVAGLVGVVASCVANGQADAGSVVDSIIALLVAVGVYQVPNS